MNNMVEVLYKKFAKTNYPKQEFSNRVLYEMCENNSEHVDIDVIAGKVLLIGRSYAVAVERFKETKKPRKDNDLLYYEEIAPSIMEINLDDQLAMIQGPIEDNYVKILETQNSLVECISSVTSDSKRSFASKYLHFHDKTHFFMYDERARSTLATLGVKYDEQVNRCNKGDSEQRKFFGRMITLRRQIAQIENKIINDIVPRRLDDFLLWVERSEKS